MKWYSVTCWIWLRCFEPHPPDPQHISLKLTRSIPPLAHPWGHSHGDPCAWYCIRQKTWSAQLAQLVHRRDRQAAHPQLRRVVGSYWARQLRRWSSKKTGGTSCMNVHHSRPEKKHPTVENGKSSIAIHVYQKTIKKKTAPFNKKTKKHGKSLQKNDVALFWHPLTLFCWWLKESMETVLMFATCLKVHKIKSSTPGCQTCREPTRVDSMPLSTGNLEPESMVFPNQFWGNWTTFVPWKLLFGEKNMCICLWYMEETR